MKKAMLFFAALLFSINASAASLTLVGDAANDGTVGIGSGSVVTAGWNGPASSGASVNDTYTLTTDALTGAFLKLTFNPLEKVSTSVTVNGFEVPVIETLGLGVAQYFWVLQAATEYVINVTIGNAFAGSNYDLRVETPIPAALWLFAPALLGFFGLRRKARSLAA